MDDIGGVVVAPLYLSFQIVHNFTPFKQQINYRYRTHSPPIGYNLLTKRNSGENHSWQWLGKKTGWGGVGILFDPLNTLCREWLRMTECDGIPKPEKCTRKRAHLFGTWDSRHLRFQPFICVLGAFMRACALSLAPLLTQAQGYEKPA